MRLQAIHDSAGEIEALITGPDDAPPVSIGLKPGQFAAAIETSTPDVSLDTVDDDAERYLIDLANRSRVTVDVVSRLEPKQAG